MSTPDRTTPRPAKPMEPTPARDAVGSPETSDETAGRRWKVQVGIEFVDRATNDLPHHLMIAIVIIEHYARSKCWAFPSTIALAKKYGCKPRNMKYVLKELVDRGWIIRVPIFPGKRRGMITILRKRIDREDLPVFDPACPDDFSEDDIREAVWRRKGVETGPSCSKQSESADSEPQTHAPQSHASQFPDQTRGNGLPLNKGQWIASRRMTNSSEEPLKTTTTENPPKSSSSFSRSPSKEPDNQADIDALAVMIGELLRLDAKDVIPRIEAERAAGFSLLAIRNAAAEMKRQLPKIRKPSWGWIYKTLRASGPDGPLPPEKPTAARPAPTYHRAPAIKPAATPPPPGFSSWSAWRTAGSPELDQAAALDREGS